MTSHSICSERLSLSVIQHIISEELPLSLSEKSKSAIIKCRNYLDKKLSETGSPIYGINTGFGYLQNVIIPDDQLSLLQHNLLLSHACGTGDHVPKEIIKLMLLLKIQSLAYGHSGINLQTVERLIFMYNNNVLPVIYTQGSLGASGDLAPLAHLSLPLIGAGKVWLGDEECDSAEWLSRSGMKALSLQSKEGLALINGTQFMTAYGVHILLNCKRLAAFADTIGALSVDVFDCRIEPFKTLSHQIRPHKGQVETAEKIFGLLQGSELIVQDKKQVQDPYSFRCIPQVHGASKEVFEYAGSVIDVEINSVTDNPNIFPDEDEIISAGNFHGQPLAFAFDFTGIALAELGSISERRTFQLISGQRGLPNFLVKDAGLNSGLMIPQYTAASIASENKQLASPASVDSIVSSNGQEDHVSMGANAVTKCLRIMLNVERILAIELLTAAQGLEFKRPGKSSPELEKMVLEFRKTIPEHEHDRLLSVDIKNSVKFIKSYTI